MSFPYQLWYIYWCSCFDSHVVRLNACTLQKFQCTSETGLKYWWARTDLNVSSMWISCHGTRGTMQASIGGRKSSSSRYWITSQILSASAVMNLGVEHTITTFLNLHHYNNKVNMCPYSHKEV